MLLAFIKIGFLDVGFADILDVILVGLLIYQLYRLIKGSLAFNIFVGLLLVYLIWFVVSLMEMQLLKRILEQFVNVGVIALLIVFQPEVRKFLLYLGRGSLARRLMNLRRFWKNNGTRDAEVQPVVASIMLALSNLQKSKTGAIMVFTETTRLQFYANTGVIMDSQISSKLLESIFEKSSPLHDGAVIISGLRIVAAGCVLPVSENPGLPSRVGLRHKATVGITELSDALAILVSEERGKISYAINGKLYQDVKPSEMEEVLTKYLQVFY